MRPMPKTPFATRLTGTAKELRLRIQNIIQGDKKRSPLLLVVPVLLAAALCSSLVAFTAPEPEPALTPVVNSGEEVPPPVIPDAPEPEPEPEPVPDPVPGSTPLPPLSEALASLELPGGIAYVAVDPNEPEYPYSPPAKALYWKNAEGIVCLIGHLSRNSNVFQLDTVHALGLECLELTRYTRLEDGSTDDTPNSFGTILYDLGQEDGVPLRIARDEQLTYRDVNSDGTVDVVDSFGRWHTWTPYGRLITVSPEWREIPGVGWEMFRRRVNGTTFRAVAEETDVLYWLDGGTWKELARYPAVYDDQLFYYTVIDGLYSDRPAYVLGHRVLCVIHALGGRFMADFYTVDTPEPAFLLTIEEEATSFCDLDGDGMEELALQSNSLWFHKWDMAPFILLYDRGPDGQLRCADLSQVFPEIFAEEHDYPFYSLSIDSDGSLVRYLDGEYEPLFTGPEIMAAIDTANAWSDQIPGWREITDRTGPRGPGQ